MCFKGSEKEGVFFSEKFGLDVLQGCPSVVVVIGPIREGDRSVEERAIEGVGEIKVANAIAFDTMGPKIEEIEEFFDAAIEDEMAVSAPVHVDVGFEGPKGEVDGDGKVEVDERLLVDAEVSLEGELVAIDASCKGAGGVKGLKIRYRGI